jgi:heme/copper-type cytochrome/quinol oxidase subunit 3
MIPYIPTTKPMTGVEQEALVRIFDEAHTYTPGVRLTLANRIIEAGFARRIPAMVTRFQLWSYFIETCLLALSTYVIGPAEHPFIFGALAALTAGSALTWVSGLIINYGIKTGALK